MTIIRKVISFFTSACIICALVLADGIFINTEKAYAHIYGVPGMDDPNEENPFDYIQMVAYELDEGVFTLYGNIDYYGPKELDFKADYPQFGYYSECDSIYSIKTSSSVTNIYYDAFEGLNNLKSVSLTDSVVSIDGYAFADCTQLSSLKLSKNLLSIGECSFSYCTSLSDIVLPDGITKIDNEAFINCNNLESINIPESVMFIGENAFDGCDKLIETENSVQYVDNWVVGVEDTSLKKLQLRPDTRGIAENAFKDCHKLSYVSIPDDVINVPYIPCDKDLYTDNGITYHGSSAVKADSDISEAILRPNIKYISSNAFNTCSKLKNISFSENLSFIGRAAFSGCSSLETLEFPENLTEICDNAFNNCSSLNSVIIPPKLKNIEYATFQDCSKLSDVDISASVVCIDGGFFNCEELKKLYIPENVIYINPNTFPQSTHTAYYVTIYGKDGSEAESFAICNGIKFISDTQCGEHCYWNFDKDTGTLSISGSGGIFSYCDNHTFFVRPWEKFKDEITNITFDTDIDAIGANAFSNLNGLKHITIPYKIYTIETMAFYQCENLQSVTLQNKYCDIGNYAFKNCKNLSDIILPADNNSRIGGDAFDGCIKLRSFNYPDVSYYFDFFYGFNNCSSLTSISVNENADSIEGAFAFCSSLKSVIIADNILCIYSSFNDCTALPYITIPENFHIINDSFENCTALKSIKFKETDIINPDSPPDRIIQNSFNNCTSLTSVTIPEYITDIENSFMGCTNLKEIRGKKNSAAQKLAQELNIDFTETNEVTDIALKYGDLNYDSIVDMDDLTILSLYLLRDISFSDDQIKAADVTGNSMTDIADLAELKQYIMMDDITLGPPDVDYPVIDGYTDETML